MAITDQLKSLYVKLGGDESTTASNIEEWIDKIGDVSSNDNKGEGSGSGGNDEFIVTGTVHNQDYEDAVYDATYEDILAAHNAGKNCSSTYRRQLLFGL